MTLIEFDGHVPVVPESAFVADGARLIGQVMLGEDASVWYNCVLRADARPITVGPRSNIQDGSIVHITRKNQGTEIGADCLIGHLAIVHGCRLHDGVFVGLGAIVMDDCEIEAEGMLAAGAMLTPGKRIGAGEMWAGRPARLVRALTDAERAGHRAGVAGYVALARAHREAAAR